MEIAKLLNGATEADLQTSTKILVDWDQLNSTIEKAVMLRQDEQISGYVVNETGIMVSIHRKPGRKKTTNDQH